MNCPQCGHSNLPGSAFCDNCGFDLSQAPVSAPAPAYPAAPAPVPAYPAAAPTMPAVGSAVCPQCGTPVSPGAAFCDNCGASLAAAAPAAPVWPQQPAPAVQPPYQAPVPQPPYQAPPTVAAACPQCGQPLVPGAMFCDSCGANLAAQPVVQPPVGPAPMYPPVQPPVMGMRMRLVVASSGVQLPLAGKQEFYIGREDPIGQFFPDADLTPHGGDAGGVSRRHAKIVVYGNQVMFEDLNSTNGSFVNKIKVQPGQPVPLTDGAEVRLGKVIMTFHTS